VLAGSRHKRSAEEGSEEITSLSTWELLFDAGGMLGTSGIPFDEERTEPPNERWIETDIHRGTRKPNLTSCEMLASVMLQGDCYSSFTVSLRSSLRCPRRAFADLLPLTVITTDPNEFKIEDRLPQRCVAPSL
jgi:hypothetical protein